MIDGLLALAAMFIGGLACGIMLRDWQSERRAARLREIELRAEWERCHWESGRSYPLPVPKIPTAKKTVG